jgi:hypothetical protein
MYAIGRKKHKIETAGRMWLSDSEPYIGCSVLEGGGGEGEEDIQHYKTYVLL